MNLPPNIDELWQQFAADRSNVELRNQLVTLYLPTVRLYAYRLFSKLPVCPIELADLQSAAFLGLLNAANGFDPSRSEKFPTYAAKRIRGAMLDWLREQDWVPRLVRTRCRKLSKAQAELQKEKHREPTPRELARRLQIPLARLDAFLAETQDVAVGSLHAIYDADHKRLLCDLLHDPRTNAPGRRLEQLDTLRKLTRGLNRSERLILISYYWEDLPMWEIGAMLGLSESYVSKMHKALCIFLREKLSSRRTELFEGAADAHRCTA